MRTRTPLQQHTRTPLQQHTHASPAAHARLSSSTRVGASPERSLAFVAAAFSPSPPRSTCSRLAPRPPAPHPTPTHAHPRLPSRPSSTQRAAQHAPSAPRLILEHSARRPARPICAASHPRCAAPCALAFAAKIQNDLRILTERLARINDNLARKISSRNEYDKTIQETEAAYAKVRARATPGAAPRLPPLRCRRSRLSHLAPPGPTWPRPPRRLWRVLKRCCTC